MSEFSMNQSENVESNPSATAEPRFAPEPRVNRSAFGSSDYERVEPGKLLECRIVSAELANSSRGFPYMKVRCELKCNGWLMTCCHFLDQKRCTTPEETQAAGVEFLSKFGFRPSAPKGSRYDDCRALAEIGSWVDSSGKSRLNIKKLFRDQMDYANYQKWLADRQKKQAPRREPMELPEI